MGFGKSFRNAVKKTGRVAGRYVAPVAGAVIGTIIAPGVGSVVGGAVGGAAGGLVHQGGRTGPGGENQKRSTRIAYGAAAGAVAGTSVAVLQAAGADPQTGIFSFDRLMESFGNVFAPEYGPVEPPGGGFGGAVGGTLGGLGGLFDVGSGGASLPGIVPPGGGVSDGNIGANGQFGGSVPGGDVGLDVQTDSGTKPLRGGFDLKPLLFIGGGLALFFLLKRGH